MVRCASLHREALRTCSLATVAVFRIFKSSLQKQASTARARRVINVSLDMEMSKPRRRQSACEWRRTLSSISATKIKRGEVGEATFAHAAHTDPAMMLHNPMRCIFGSSFVSVLEFGKREELVLRPAVDVCLPTRSSASSLHLPRTVHELDTSKSWRTPSSRGAVLLGGRHRSVAPLLTKTY